jgi:hypothetical protein
MKFKEWILIESKKFHYKDVEEDSNYYKKLKKAKL